MSEFGDYVSPQEYWSVRTAYEAGVRERMAGKPLTVTDSHPTTFDVLDSEDFRDDMSPAELEEYYAAEAELYDPDNPYSDLSEDDRHALNCPHVSLIIGPGNSRDCEDCGSHFR